MIYEAYFALDEKIMKGVNVGVRAWNWTTGRTKKDLSNALTVCGSTMTSTASAYDGKLVLATALIIMGVTDIVSNELYLKKEEDAINSSLMDLSAENYKRRAAFHGPFLAGVGTINLSTNGSNSSDCATLGLFAWSVAEYVKRADYLPPRKNCVSRGLEKLEQLVRTPQPALNNFKQP